MDTRQAAARQAGVLYLLFSILAVVGEFALPRFMVPGDATATARNISTAEFAYRTSILIGFVTLIMFIFVVASLYNLLKDVDKTQALLMVLSVSVGVAVAIANLFNKIAPLILLSGADYLSVFSKPQLDALALAFLRLHGSGISVVTAFWGLWLFPFGILVIKSGFLPRILGILLMIAGFGYLTTSVTSIVLPAYRPVVSPIVTPLYFGELPIVFWLLIKGTKAPQLQADRARRPRAHE